MTLPNIPKQKEYTHEEAQQLVKNSIKDIIKHRKANHITTYMQVEEQINKKWLIRLKELKRKESVHMTQAQKLRDEMIQRATSKKEVQMIRESVCIDINEIKGKIKILDKLIAEVENEQRNRIKR